MTPKTASFLRFFWGVFMCLWGSFCWYLFYLGSLGTDCWSDTAAWMIATDLDLKVWGAYCNFCLQDDLQKGHGLSHIEIRHLVSLKFQICDIHMLEGHNPPTTFFVSADVSELLSCFCEASKDESPM